MNIKVLSVIIILISLGALFCVLGAIGLGGGIQSDDISLLIMISVSVVSIFLIFIFTKELFKKPD